MVLFISITTKTFPQNFIGPYPKNLAVYNIGLNVLIGGIGKAINKQKNEKFIIAFLKGAGWGTVGGSVIYFSKSRNHLLSDETSKAAWLNRFIYFTGHSVVNNVSQGKKPWDNYHFQLYGADINIKYEDSLQFKCRVSLATIASVIFMGIDGHGFNLDKSLKYGVFYFEYNAFKANYSRSFSFNQPIGFALSNAIAIDKYWLKGTPPPYSPFIPPYFQASPEVIPHELIHTYQYIDYLPALSFTKPLFKKEHVIAKYIYFDISPMPFLYLLEKKRNMWPNFFEYEAYKFDGRKF